MGYGYNPIVGENWRYNPDKTFKISRSKIELFIFIAIDSFARDFEISSAISKPLIPFLTLLKFPSGNVIVILSLICQL